MRPWVRPWVRQDEEGQYHVVHVQRSRDVLPSEGGDDWSQVGLIVTAGSSAGKGPKGPEADAVVRRSAPWCAVVRRRTP